MIQSLDPLSNKWPELTQKEVRGCPFLVKNSVQCDIFAIHFNPFGVEIGGITKFIFFVLSISFLFVLLRCCYEKQNRNGMMKNEEFANIFSGFQTTTDCVHFFLLGLKKISLILRRDRFDCSQPRYFSALAKEKSRCTQTW